VLDDAAFGAATPVVPKFISHADPASRWTGANGGLAFFAYCTNYLIDLKCAVIVDVEATTAVRQAEVTAQRRMIDRTQERFGLWPERLAGDRDYGSAENLAWLLCLPRREGTQATPESLSSAAPVRRRERHDALPRQQAGLPAVFFETAMLSQRTRPQDPAFHP